MDDSDSAELGELSSVRDGWCVRFVRTLPHPPERVWRALTDPDEIAAWFPTTIDGPRQAGAALTFRFRNGEAPDFTGTVIECRPPHLFEFLWGDDRIRLELSPVPGGTSLMLSDTMAERGKAARDAAGWHTCLTALSGRLSVDRAGVQDDPRTQWQPVLDRYRAAFGPLASSVGPPAG